MPLRARSEGEPGSLTGGRTRLLTCVLAGLRPVLEAFQAVTPQRRSSNASSNTAKRPRTSGHPREHGGPVRPKERTDSDCFTGPEPVSQSAGSVFKSLAAHPPVLTGGSSRYLPSALWRWLRSWLRFTVFRPSPRPVSAKHPPIPDVPDRTRRWRVRVRRSPGSRSSAHSSIRGRGRPATYATGCAGR